MIGKWRHRGAASTDDKRPRVIPKCVWVMCCLCMADVSGVAQRWFLERERNRAYAGYLVEEALLAGKRSWSDLRARRICTLGLLYAAMCKYCKPHGKWGGVVMGVPEGALLAALRDPYCTKPCKWLPAMPHWKKPRKEPLLRDPALPFTTTLNGTHEAGGSNEHGSVGYLTALVQCGAVYTQQLPADECEPFELFGDSGHPTARVWLPALALERIDDDDVRFELLRAAQVAHDAVKHWTGKRSSRAADLGRSYEPPF